ncbi:hypothetical protein ANI_1_1648144 [Paecilomyces variotii No. 5]|uniref:DNA replication factor Cdt1 C-terminal domain-containing protein n=1 Tax=Byssochlamys spectabilis (strain No. 5 / NBRC 109023) TaxID=1356009 RepID=V5FMX2_BYSSN|nr:hypothetical protein ANI_1_1648144 [Paecilomyces variotii No. 5]
MPRASTAAMTTRRSSLRARPGQPGIQSFARATKPGARTSIGPADEKKILEKQTPLLPASPSKKRKLNGIGQVDCVPEEEVANDVTATPSKTLRFSELALSTPRRTKSAPPRPLRKRREPSPEESPSRTPSVEEESSSSAAEDAGSRPTSPEEESPAEEKASSITRPACFDDLSTLHSCFLSALSLHYAHNGASTPADLKEFLPSVQKVWRKRKVVTKDLQRLVQVWDEESPSSAGVRFRIANYGLGKVCLERVVATGQSMSPLDESELQWQFERRLDQVWKKLVDSVPDLKGKDQVELLDLLDLAPIHESLTAFTSFRKGQQRLQDLRGGVIRMKTAMMKAKTQIDDSPKPPPVAATARRKGLLDRIKNKELRQSKLPPPPSKEMLLRRSAAERVEEVARVLMVLRPSGVIGTGPWAIAASQKKPYSLDAIVQNVQNSVRSPISDKEVEVCVDILARKDIAGDWVKLVAINDLRSVVLGSGRGISPSDIGTKVSALKIGWEDPIIQ